MSGETWRCPGCEDTVSVMGMCQRCGVFGVRREHPVAARATPVPALREAAEGLLRALTDSDDRPDDDFDALIWMRKLRAALAAAAPVAEDDPRQWNPSYDPAPVAEGLDVEALRAEIEAELEMVPRRKRPQFDAGAAAAYHYVLSLLPPPARLASEVERGAAEEGTP